MDEKKVVKVGDAVVYGDMRGKTHVALVTAVWPGEYGFDKEPGINLVFVSDDESRSDDYGRQTERMTSVVHRSCQPAHGMFWNYLS